jgi:hypothetical protein
MNSEADPKESTALTFWKSKEFMTAFYNMENKILTECVDKLKPLFSAMPERTDYKIILFKAT